MDRCFAQAAIATGEYLPASGQTPHLGGSSLPAGLTTHQGAMGDDGEGQLPRRDKLTTYLDALRILASTDVTNRAELITQAGRYRTKLADQVMPLLRRR